LKDLGGLLFELSNEDRLYILRELKKKPMRLSHVSEKFGFTVPETARNISRLSKEELIAKDSRGFYYLTPVGEEALELIVGFDFLSKNRSYFTTHSLSQLPREFSVGLGSLEKCRFVNKVTTTMRNIERVMHEAEEYFWFAADQLLETPIFQKTFSLWLIIRYLTERRKKRSSKADTLTKLRLLFSFLKRKLQHSVFQKQVEDLTILDSHPKTKFSISGQNLYS
jgi:hypothetical protein